MSFIAKFNSLIIKTKILIFEKKFKHIKYIYQKEKSKFLVVSFSGFAGGKKANYNYIKTLNHFSCNKLFLLDDYGSKINKGSYYLGENGNFFLVNEIIELIQIIKTTNNITHIVMIGSSKGGSAALFYSLKMNDVNCVIIGAPQYYIGNYLSNPKHTPILQAIAGDNSKQSIFKLNELLPRLIESQEHKPRIYIHYSPMEHTYIEHIKPMLNNLRDNGFEVFEDSAYSYTEHKDVAKYFPPFLVKQLSCFFDECRDF